MGTNTGTVMTIANSIIGVSVLAMPFCFKECGIFLSILMLILSSILSRLTCFLVLKAAVMSRRRNFEFLAFHVFGTTGKFLVELCIIGFLMGTCIAFFVVVGDLGPAILAKTLNIANTSSLRPSVLIGLAFLVVLPLGLLRNVDSLSSICAASIGFYVCLVLKVIAEALPHLRSGIWLDKVEYWKPDGILQCLPIFSMALFCQTQLFEIYETMPNASLERMNGAVRSAINICTCVYISVGFFGYVAFCTESFSGNILMSFSPSLMSDVIKLGFVLSVAVSFPLVIFPCRASLYSLLFRRIQVPHHEVASSYIPEPRFKCITLFVVSVSLVIGLMIPNIELVLGLVGSTIGVGICVIFPAMAFIFVSTKENTERIVAQVLFFVGILILVLGTYATLFTNNESAHVPAKIATNQEFANKLQLPNIEKIINQDNNKIVPPIVVPHEVTKDIVKVPVLVPLNVVSEASVVKNVGVVKDSVEVRQEPPVPVEPVDKTVKESKEVPIKETKESVPEAIQSKDLPVVEKQLEEIATVKSKDGKEKANNEQVINKDAIKKEDEELAEAEKQSKEDTDKKNNQLLLKLEKHKEEQHKLLEEQRQILQELKEQKKESDKEKEGNNVPAVAAPKLELKENAQMPERPEKESNVKEQDVVPKDQRINPDFPKMPKFGYVSQPDKRVPPKQPMAYEQRFSGKEEKAKPVDIPVQSLEKLSNVESVKDKKQGNIQNPQIPSIKTLLIPSGQIVPSVKPDSNEKQNNPVNNNEILHQVKAFEVEAPIVNKVQPLIVNDQNHEIDKVKNLEILKANIEVNEAKAMRREILGTGGGGSSKEALGNHERDKRDAIEEASDDPIKIGEPSTINEAAEKNEVKDAASQGNCELKDELESENKIHSSDVLRETVKKSEPSSEPLASKVVASESAIKTSSHLSDPIVQSLGDPKNLDNLEKELLLDNGVKPMPRDLKSISPEVVDDQSGNDDREANLKKEEV